MTEGEREFRTDDETGAGTEENESVIRLGETDPEELGADQQRREGGSSRDPEKGKFKP